MDWPDSGRSGISSRLIRSARLAYLQMRHLDSRDRTAVDLLLHSSERRRLPQLSTLSNPTWCDRAATEDNVSAAPVRYRSVTTQFAHTRGPESLGGQDRMATAGHDGDAARCHRRA